MARKTRCPRFFRQRMMTCWDSKSMLSRVNDSASDILHPENASIQQNVRTSSEHCLAVLTNESTSFDVKYFRCP